MKIEFSSKNFEIPESLKKFTEKRLQKLKKFFDEEDWQVKVLIRESKYIYESEISVLHDGEWVKAKAKAEEAEFSIVQSINHLKTQLIKKTKKLKEKKRRLAHQEKINKYEKKEGEVTKRFLRRNLENLEIETMSENQAFSIFNPEKKPFLLYRDVNDNKLKLLFEERGKKILLELGTE